MPVNQTKIPTVTRVTQTAYGPAYQTPKLNYSPLNPVLKAAQATQSKVTSGGGSKSTSSSSSSSGGGSVNISSQNQRINDSQKAGEDAAKKQQEAMLAAIEQEFSSIMGSLNNQETALNAQMPITEAQINTQADQLTGSIEGQKTQQLADLGTQQTAAQQGAQGLVGQSRQVYNELLSKLNSLQGSGAQAYSEILGSQTAKNIGQVQQGLQNTLTQIAGEKTRLTQFYNDKVTGVKQNAQNAILQAQQDLRNEIAKINSSRTQTQQWKSTQNLQALANFQTQVAQITDAANAAKNALEQWAVSRQDALNATASSQAKAGTFGLPQFKDYLSSLQSAGQTLSPSQTTALQGVIGQPQSSIDLSKLTPFAVDPTTGLPIDPNTGMPYQGSTPQQSIQLMR